jgi:hypothetical protein
MTMRKIENLEKGLQDQLSDLNTKIKVMEADLLTLKEGFFKVQGALEIIEVLKNDVLLTDCNADVAGAS